MTSCAIKTVDWVCILNLLGPITGRQCPDCSATTSAKVEGGRNDLRALLKNEYDYEYGYDDDDYSVHPITLVQRNP